MKSTRHFTSVSQTNPAGSLLPPALLYAADDIASFAGFDELFRAEETCSLTVTAKPPAKKQLIRVGHSPDPDDAFMFHALANGKIDTGPYEFRHELVDIETLNRRAFAGELELTAVSIHAYALLTDKYVLCPCGASMGDRYGPMVVAPRQYSIDDLRPLTIAVPGTLTTAYLALRLCLGNDFKHVVVPFDQIIDAAVSGQYQGQPIDAGLIIHEGQLTYGDRGLKLVVDLGQWWFEQTGLPLPLGGNVLRRDLGTNTIREVNRLLEAEHPLRPGTSHRSAAVRLAIRPRSRSREGRPVRRHVRQRLDARFRPPRPRSRAAIGRRTRRRGDSEAGRTGICGRMKWPSANASSAARKPCRPNATARSPPSPEQLDAARCGRSSSPALSGLILFLGFLPLAGAAMYVALGAGVVFVVLVVRGGACITSSGAAGWATPFDAKSKRKSARN